MHSSYNGVHCSQVIDRRTTLYSSSSFIIQQPKSQNNPHTSSDACAFDSLLNETMMTCDVRYSSINPSPLPLPIKQLLWPQNVFHCQRIIPQLYPATLCSFQVRAQDHKKACVRRRYSTSESLIQIESQATTQDVLLSIKHQNYGDKTIAWNSTRLKCVIKHNPHQQENASWKSDCLFPT